MSIEELEELLWLKKWSKRQLARELSMTENAIYRWFLDRRPSAVASILLRQWLNDARRTSDAPYTKAERRKIDKARADITAAQARIAEARAIISRQSKATA